MFAVFIDAYYTEIIEEGKRWTVKAQSGLVGILVII